MEEIRFSIMEEESPYFSAVSQRVWGEYEQKNEELSNPMQESEVLAEPEPQNETEAPKEQTPIDKSGAVNFHIAPETEESAGKGFAAKKNSVRMWKQSERLKRLRAKTVLPRRKNRRF